MVPAREEQPLAIREGQATAESVLEHKFIGDPQYVAGKCVVGDGVAPSIDLTSRVELDGMDLPRNSCGIELSSCVWCRPSLSTVHVALLSCLLGATMVKALWIPIQAVAHEVSDPQFG